METKPIIIVASTSPKEGQRDPDHVVIRKLKVEAKKERTAQIRVFLGLDK